MFSTKKMLKSHARIAGPLFILFFSFLLGQFLTSILNKGCTSLLICILKSILRVAHEIFPGCHPEKNPAIQNLNFFLIYCINPVFLGWRSRTKSGFTEPEIFLGFDNFGCNFSNQKSLHI